MKKYFFLFFLIISFIINSNAFAGIHEGSGPGDMPPHHRNMHKYDGMFFGDPEALKAKLNLSDDQVDKISSINLDYKKKLLMIREKIQPKEIKLQGLLLEDNINLKEVRSLLEEISALHVEMGMLRINQRLDIEKILTAGQRNRLKDSRGGMMGMPR